MVDKPEKDPWATNPDGKDSDDKDYQHYPKNTKLDFGKDDPYLGE